MVLNLLEVVQVASNLYSLKFLPSETAAITDVCPSEIESSHHVEHEHAEQVDLHNLVDPPFQPIESTRSDPPTFESILRECFPRKSNTLNSTPWHNQNKIPISKSNRNRHIQCITTLLRTLSSDNTENASEILCLTLKSMNQMKNVELNDLIVENIKAFLNTNLTQLDNATRDAKHSITTASLGSIEGNFNKIKIRLAISKRVYQSFRSSDYNNTSFTPLDRSKEISTLQRLQRESIFKFGHSDESSRIDSNAQRCVTIHHDGKKERHPGRA